jgi:hypothetical protein
MRPSAFAAAADDALSDATEKLALTLAHAHDARDEHMVSLLLPVLSAVVCAKENAERASLEESKRESEVRQ